MRAAEARPAAALLFTGTFTEPAATLAAGMVRPSVWNDTARRSAAAAALQGGNAQVSHRGMMWRNAGDAACMERIAGL